MQDTDIFEVIKKARKADISMEEITEIFKFARKIFVLPTESGIVVETTLEFALTALGCCSAHEIKYQIIEHAPHRKCFDIHIVKLP